MPEYQSLAEVAGHEDAESLLLSPSLSWVTDIVREARELTASRNDTSEIHGNGRVLEQPRPVFPDDEDFMPGAVGPLPPWHPEILRLEAEFERNEAAQLEQAKKFEAKQAAAFARQEAQQPDEETKTNDQ